MNDLQFIHVRNQPSNNALWYALKSSFLCELYRKKKFLIYKPLQTASVQGKSGEKTGSIEWANCQVTNQTEGEMTHSADCINTSIPSQDLSIKTKVNRGRETLSLPLFLCPLPLLHPSPNPKLWHPDKLQSLVLGQQRHPASENAGTKYEINTKQAVHLLQNNIHWTHKQQGLESFWTPCLHQVEQTHPHPHPHPSFRKTQLKEQSKGNNRQADKHRVHTAWQLYSPICD